MKYYYNLNDLLQNIESKIYFFKEQQLFEIELFCNIIQFLSIFVIHLMYLFSIKVLHYFKEFDFIYYKNSMCILWI